MDYILPFEEAGKDWISLVGGKNANLGEMIGAGLRVPPGFSVTTNGYLAFLEKNGIGTEIAAALASLDPDDVAELEETAGRVRSLVTEAPVPDDVRDAIRDGYDRLSKKCAIQRLPVAVRSSATAEDLPTASFAGQQDTYLWIEGIDRVLEHVRKCWASLFTPRAISYRVKNKFLHEKVLISVGIQKMVNSKCAGVMFTLNPTDGDLSKVVIEGSWGLGETVVSGSVNPDKFVVDKVVLEINERTISNKHVECAYDGEKGEVIHDHVAPEKQSQCCLEDREIKELVGLAKEIEAHYGCPQDIEWAIDRDLSFPLNMFIVQSRPETVWSQRRREPVIGEKSGYQLLMERAMSRITVQ
jgi:pyruvate,water dikinase